MERYIFVSSANHSLQSDDLDSIAETSTANNVRDDLTGILILGDGTFFQILEGSKEAMERTIARIEADTRHTGLSVLRRGPVSERMFPDWSLGCYRTKVATTRTTWTPIELNDLLEALPPSPAPEIEIFLRTFFGSVAGRNPV